MSLTKWPRDDGPRQVAEDLRDPMGAMAGALENRAHSGGGRPNSVPCRKSAVRPWVAFQGQQIPGCHVDGSLGWKNSLHENLLPNREV